MNNYDFGSRVYNSTIGRWLSVDPLFAKQPGFSPYSYAWNRPIAVIDPSGAIPWPVLLKWKSFTPKIDSGFGKREGNSTQSSNHLGLDINYSGGGNTDLGAPVVATHDGIIKKIVKYDSHTNSAGTYVIIEAPDGSFQTAYMHLDKLSAGLDVGDPIKEGQQIGEIGGSGYGLRTPKEVGAPEGTKPHVAHLHYEIRELQEDGVTFKPIDPKKYGKLIDPQKWVDEYYKGNYLVKSLNDRISTNNSFIGWYTDAIKGYNILLENEYWNSARIEQNIDKLSNEILEMEIENIILEMERDSKIEELKNGANE